MTPPTPSTPPTKSVHATPEQRAVTSAHGEDAGRRSLLDAPGQLADYEEHHRNPANKWTHYIGIPLIVLGIINFLWQVPLVAVTQGYTLTLAEPVILVVAGFYALMHVGLGAAMLVFFALLFGAAVLVGNVWVALGLFIGGWVLQFVGHGVFEKRSPAFTKNLLHLLIGPLWIVNRWLNAAGIRMLQQPASSAPGA